jgi:DNA-3-methyladenine glycosylase II
VGPGGIELDFSGPFSLRAAAGFGFGPNVGRQAPSLRLAFPVDGESEDGYAGVLLHQEADDAPVRAEIDLGHPDTDPEIVVRQVRRILSLDHDGLGFAAVGDRDPVLGRLQRAHPGQRPVLFPSPYEAAAWSVISARRRSAQAAETRKAIARELGRTFALAGEELAAFPQPDRLLGVEPGPGLPPEKVERLRGIARAALAGELDAGVLAELGPERALAQLQLLRGIGPFYAGLIVLRAVGFADAMLSAPEPKGLTHLARYYDLGPDPDPAAVAAITDGWRPFRTWALVLVRLAGDRGTA